jgi:hypothetical protein
MLSAITQEDAEVETDIIFSGERLIGLTCILPHRATTDERARSRLSYHFHGRNSLSLIIKVDPMKKNNQMIASA